MRNLEEAEVGRRKGVPLDEANEAEEGKSDGQSTVRLIPEENERGRRDAEGLKDGGMIQEGKREEFERKEKKNQKRKRGRFAYLWKKPSMRPEVKAMRVPRWPISF